MPQASTKIWGKQRRRHFHMSYGEWLKLYLLHNADLIVQDRRRGIGVKYNKIIWQIPFLCQKINAMISFAVGYLIEGVRGRGVVNEDGGWSKDVFGR